VFGCHDVSSLVRNRRDITPAINHGTWRHEGSNLYKVISEPVVSLRPVLQLSSDNSRMNLQGARHSENISLSEKRFLRGNEMIHLLLWDTEIRRRFVRHSFILSDAWTSARPISFKLCVQDRNSATMLPQNVLNLVT
jgi:hypothetical protein